MPGKTTTKPKRRGCKAKPKPKEKTQAECAGTTDDPIAEALRAAKNPRVRAWLAALFGVSDSAQAAEGSAA